MLYNPFFSAHSKIRTILLKTNCFS